MQSGSRGCWFDRSIMVVSDDACPPGARLGGTHHQDNQRYVKAGAAAHAPPAESVRESVIVGKQQSTQAFGDHDVHRFKDGDVRP